MTEQAYGTETLGEKLFRLRDYTPIPLIALLLFVADPSVLSATLGTLLIVAGELFRLYSVAFIGSISRTRKSSLGGALVRSGPFRWVRNPLYVGNFIIVLGVAVFSGRLWFPLLTALLFAWQYYWIVQYEEKLLEEKFGDDYRLYKEEVPPWIPKKCPTLTEIEWPTSFSGALYSERRTTSAILAIMVLMLLRA